MKTVCILQHACHETLGSLAWHFTAAGVAWRDIPLYLGPSRERPWQWHEIAGLVILGGPMNVDQVSEYPFLRHELDWIREALARNLPVLGICLGAQLLAKTLGSRVFRNDVQEIGWYFVELTAPPDDPLFGGLIGRHRVFQWHGDTFELPAGAVPLARGELCAQQAFRCGARAYGLQFHAEVTAEMIHLWLDEAVRCRDLAGLDHVDPIAIGSQVPTAMREMEVLARHVLSRFAAMCSPAGQERR